MLLQPFPAQPGAQADVPPARRLASTLCMKGDSGMASGSRDRNADALRVVLPCHCRAGSPAVWTPSMKNDRFASSGSVEASAGATAAFSCTTRRSSGRASGTPLS